MVRLLTDGAFDVADDAADFDSLVSATATHRTSSSPISERRRQPSSTAGRTQSLPPGQPIAVIRPGGRSLSGPSLE